MRLGWLGCCAVASSCADGRIGQEAPKQEEEPVHDGRTLFERLQTAQVGLIWYGLVCRRELVVR